MDRNFKKIIGTILLFTLCYFGGRGIAQALDARGLLPVSGSAVGNWGLSFQEEGKAPVGNADASYLKNFDAYYMEETEEKCC